MSSNLISLQFLHRENKLSQIYDAFARWMNSFLASKNWRIKVAVFCTLFCVVTSVPNYLNFSETSLNKSPYRDMLEEQYGMLSQQIGHPFQQIRGNGNSHGGKLAFRFVPAIIGMAIPSNNVLVRMRIIYLINNIAGFLSFYSIASLVYGFSKNKLIAALGAFNMTVLYIGKCFFFDTFLWNDGIAYCFLALSMLNLRWLLKILFLLLAYFTDERALFGGLLVYVYFMLSAYCENNGPISLKNHIPYFISYFIYICIRLYLQYYKGLYTSISREDSVSLFLYIKELKSPFLAFIGLFFPFKLWWIVFAASVWWLRKQRWMLAIYVGTLMALLVIALSVFDISRSITYAYVAIVIGMFLIYKRTIRFGPQKQAYAFFLLLLCNFFLPTIYLIKSYFHMIPPINKILNKI